IQQEKRPCFNKKDGPDRRIRETQDIADGHRNEGQHHEQDEERITRPVRLLVLVVAAARTEPPVQQESDDETNSSKELKVWLKALIGRNLYDDEAFYPVINKTDKVILKAREVLGKG
ncbi:MAG: hypothetical protein IKN32_10415, partial [Bacteroidales bacterium]|nr:hypothetical protein [Bacteroidales bacterium]